MNKEQTKEQEQEYIEALMTRNLYVRKYGSGYAIKWFAKWQESQKK